MKYYIKSVTIKYNCITDYWKIKDKLIKLGYSINYYWEWKQSFINRFGNEIITIRKDDTLLFDNLVDDTLLMVN